MLFYVRHVTFYLSKLLLVTSKHAIKAEQITLGNLRTRHQRQNTLKLGNLKTRHQRQKTLHFVTSEHANKANKTKQDNVCNRKITYIQAAINTQKETKLSCVLLPLPFSSSSSLRLLAVRILKKSITAIYCRNRSETHLYHNSQNNQDLCFQCCCVFSSFRTCAFNVAACSAPPFTAKVHHLPEKDTDTNNTSLSIF